MRDLDLDAVLAMAAMATLFVLAVTLLGCFIVSVWLLAGHCG